MVLNKEQIQKQAKEILDKFAKSLAKVDDKDIDIGVERDEFERQEGNGKECEASFKQKILRNAPEHDENHIIVERGNWKS